MQHLDNCRVSGLAKETDEATDTRLGWLLFTSPPKHVAVGWPNSRDGKKSSPVMVPDRQDPVFVGKAHWSLVRIRLSVSLTSRVTRIRGKINGRVISLAGVSVGAGRSLRQDPRPIGIRRGGLTPENDLCFFLEGILLNGSGGPTLSQTLFNRPG